MSYRSGHHYSDHHHPHDHGRTPPRRPANYAAKAAAIDGDGYTIVHAGKQVRLGPVVFWIVVGTIVLLGMWSAATATYFAFRDDVLTRLIARQAEMQYAYEDRIAELRSKVDRTTSRQLLDQEQFDQKLDQIMRRQTALESRATALGAIPDAAATGSIRPPARGAAVETPAVRHPKTLPDQRHRDLRGAAGSRSAAGIARAHRRQAAAKSVCQGSGRRQRAGPPADLARFASSGGRWRP